MSAARPLLRVLMVCTANICRSPTAEAVLQHRLRVAGMAPAVQVDSAGTRASSAVDYPPDPRSVAHAGHRGYDLTHVRARPIEDEDFVAFDLILAMDNEHLSYLSQVCPPGYQAKLGRLMDYAPPGSSAIVPDPYYGGAAGFEHVLDLIELACDGLVEDLQVRVRSMGWTAVESEVRYNRVKHSG
jgi:protein-tyrosine phosphatase